MNIKIITGFRKDQALSISAEEAHKAYYLFFNPDARSSFSDGLAIKGSEIDRIEPDYQATMGWNHTHVLDEDDMNEIRTKGIDRKLKAIMYQAIEVAKLGEAADLNQPLSLVIEKYKRLIGSEQRGGGMKRIGDI